MKKVAILCGGPSSEHEISCISASGVLAGLDRARFEPVLIGITREGSWHLLPLDYPLSIHQGRLPRVTNNYPVATLRDGDIYVDSAPLGVKVVFPVLHGPYGEDGTVQRELEDAHLSYVGSGIESSAIAMDKALSKKYFVDAGIRVAPGISFTDTEWESGKTSLLAQACTLGLPLFVKPSRGGSSRGTTKVKSVHDLESAVTHALQFDSIVMIESAVIGLEIECAVLESSEGLIASTPGRVWIDPKFDFYDFDAKYLDGATRMDIPAPLDPQVLAQVRTYAVAAFKAIGCKGLARVDFFVTDLNEIIINEINTMPGQTPTSAYPKMMQASGYGYKRVLTNLIESAIN